MVRLLIFYDFFSPAYKAGGPIRSLVNLINILPKCFEVFIYTSSVDLDGIPLQIKADEWISFQERVKVFYASRKKFNIRNIYLTLEEIHPHTIYINGLFTPSTVFLPLLALKFYVWNISTPIPKVVIAPRGMLQQGALALKARKKKLYLGLFKALGFNSGLLWHATDHQEYNDIRSFTGSSSPVRILSNVPLLPEINSPKQKQTCKLHLLSVSLVLKMKNHHFLLSCLKKLPDDIQVVYDIYGPIKDADYWKLLEGEIQTMPSNITVSYKGALPPDQVIKTLQQYDAFVLPTLGENFGHAIFEALGSGVPVLISDKTPWRGLIDEKAGWDLPLREDVWIQQLIETARMEGDEYKQWQEGAYQYALAYLEKQNFEQQYGKLLGIN